MKSKKHDFSKIMGIGNILIDGAMSVPVRVPCSEGIGMAKC